MNTEKKQTTDKPGSNYRENIPKDKVDQGEKVVKKPEDKDYDEKDPKFKNPAKTRERSEQPVNPVKKAPDEA
ncbi:hypothetical protein [Pedobacter sp. SYP-B3415]|uniref:hypothetical protein n=1 Tax=Pedobacter sp. SYP-B3415 TaxID=2496641 RepID=UPI00101B96AB|nr:hypothetical protein [Pedobacter sp. SYP-B3415]